MDWDRFTCYTYSVHVPVYAWFKFLIRVWYALFWLNLLHIVYLFNTKEQFILWCKSWFVDILNDMCLSQRCNSQLLHIFWINLETVELLILFVKCFRSFDIIFLNDIHVPCNEYINLQQKCHLITDIFLTLQCTTLW